MGVTKKNKIYYSVLLLTFKIECRRFYVTRTPSSKEVLRQKHTE